MFLVGWVECKCILINEVHLIMWKKGNIWLLGLYLYNLGKHETVFGDDPWCDLEADILTTGEGSSSLKRLVWGDGQSCSWSSVSSLI